MTAIITGNSKMCQLVVLEGVVGMPRFSHYYSTAIECKPNPIRVVCGSREAYGAAKVVTGGIVQAFIEGSPARHGVQLGKGGVQPAGEDI
jgi:hypothetical protein